MDRLEQAVEAIQDSDTFRQYLAVQARFWNYSWGNALLILAQRSDATQVAGYRTWQRMHRYVRRGEQGIRILVPMHTRVAVDRREDEDDEDSHAVRRLSFGVGHVFDVSQTDGEPLPQIDVPTLAGEDGAELYTRLESLASAESLVVRRGHERFAARPGMMGFLDPEQRAIYLREASMRQMTKTLAHELAHHFAGHARSTAETETEAESVSYVVLAHHGLDSGERSFPYVAVWSQEPKTLKAALTRIQAVSAQMINRLEPQ